MAVRALLSDGTWTTGTWYRVEAYSLDWDFGNMTYDLLTTERIVNVTFSNACNQVGIFLPLKDYSVTTGKTITIKLQEYTGSSWVTRTTDTFNEGTGNWEEKEGLGHFLYFPLTSYTVDTSSGKWRYSVQSSSGSYTYWVRSSTAGDWGYAVVGDADSSTPSNGDAILLRDGCTYTIDKDQTWGSGDSTTGRGFWIGSKATLKWDDSDGGYPAASYTLTLNSGARVWPSPDATITIGTPEKPIPVSKQAIIDITNSVYFIDYTQSPQFSGANNMSTKIDICGEEQSNVHAYIASRASAGQAKIITREDMSSKWSAGDTVTIIGKLKNGADNVTYTISNISGTEITLSSNLDYDVVPGGAILNRNKGRTAGVKFLNSGTGQSRRILGTVNLGRQSTFSGIYIYGGGFGGIYYTARPASNTFRNIFMESSGNRVDEYFYIYPYGTVTRGSEVYDAISNIYHFNPYGDITNHLTYLAGYANISNYFSKNNIQLPMLYLSGNGFTVDGVVVGPCYVSGSSPYGIYLQGITASSFSNMTAVYGSGSGGRALYINDVYSSTFENCSANLAYYNISFGNAVNVVFKNCDFGGEYSATGKDVYVNSDVYFLVLFTNCSVGSSGVGNVENSTTSSWLGFHKYNQTDNDHRNWFKYGYIVSTGDGLTDTTVHTSGTGKFAIRFESSSSTSPLEWSFTVPTGNIKDKTMTVAVWVKINSANYYSGTYQMPRLTVDYDNGTEVYAEAGKTTDWQQLFVTFTPTTTYGQITVTLSTMTDQTGSNAYVYWDDMSLLYPNNHSLDLGGMDNWANALPVTPPIAIPLSAYSVSNAVWEELKSSHTTAGTFGEHVGKKLLKLTDFLGLK